MSVNLLTEHHLEFIRLKEAAQAHLSLHLSKCHIAGNHISLLILLLYSVPTYTCIIPLPTRAQKYNRSLELSASIYVLI